MMRWSTMYLVSIVIRFSTINYIYDQYSYTAINLVGVVRRPCNYTADIPLEVKITDMDAMSLQIASMMIYFSMMLHLAQN
jgi:hypothetical protein